jgi:hypothetical protein
LAARPAAAQKYSDFLSPGVLFSLELNRKHSFGLGAELSFNHLFTDGDHSGIGYGAFTNSVYYFDEEYARFAVGGQANAYYVGAEAGWAVNTQGENFGASTGPFLGAFASVAVLMVAVRGTLPVFGERVSPVTVDIGLKYPVLVGGHDVTLFGSGRPHRIDGAVALAEPIAELECAVAPSFQSTLGRSERKALGRLWLEDARLEHSAVSAFLTLAGELAALGAPPSLVRRAIDAARDEAVHTRLCLEAARRHTGLVWTLPAFRPAEPPRQSIDALVRESWEDGCLGEGIAARAAYEGAAVCGDAWTRGALQTIARDESRHADLAWRILEWCVALPGAAGEDARSALSRAVDHVRGFVPVPLPALKAATLNAHGRISQRTLAEIAERGLDASRRLARSMLSHAPGRG